MATLATVADYEAWIGASVDDSTATQRVLDIVSGMAQRVARQKILQVVDDVQVLEGTWDRILHLPERPVTEVTAVTIEAVAVTDWTLLSRGRLRRDGVLSGVTPTLGYGWRGHWAGPNAKVTVTYTHGYATIPDDIVEIVCAAAARQQANPNAKTYLRIDDYSEGFSSAGPNPLFTEFEVDQLKTYRPKT